MKGEHILKLLITGGYVNLDYIQFGDKTTAISVFKPLTREAVRIKYLICAANMSER